MPAGYVYELTSSGCGAGSSRDGINLESAFDRMDSTGLTTARVSTYTPTNGVSRWSSPASVASTARTRAHSPRAPTEKAMIAAAARERRFSRDAPTAGVNQRRDRLLGRDGRWRRGLVLQQHPEHAGEIFLLQGIPLGHFIGARPETLDVVAVEPIVARQHSFERIEPLSRDCELRRQR